MRINIAFSGDDAYIAKYAPTQMLNLMNFHPEDDLHFYCLSTHLEESTRQALDVVTAYGKQNWHFVAFPEETFSGLRQIKKGHDRWGLEAYFWLLAGEYLPEDVEKCLFLDLDVVAIGSIANVYQAPMPSGSGFMFYHSEGAFAEQAIVNKVNGIPNTSHDKRRGSVGNSGIIQIDLTFLRTIGLNEAYFDPYIESLKSEEPFYEDWVIFGDQGLAHYAVDAYTAIYLSNLVVHSLNPESMAYFDETSCLVHFAGMGIKGHQMALSYVYNLGYDAITKVYLLAKLKATMLLDVDQALEDVDAILIRQREELINGQRLFGFTQRPFMDWRARKTWYVSPNNPYRLSLKNERKFRRLTYETLEPMVVNRTYRISIQVSHNFKQEKPIRLLAFNNATQDAQDVGVLMMDTDDRVTGTFEFTPERFYHGIGFASTDFPGKGAAIQIFELRIEEV